MSSSQAQSTIELIRPVMDKNAAGTRDGEPMPMPITSQKNSKAEVVNSQYASANASIAPLGSRNLQSNYSTSMNLRQVE